MPALYARATRYGPAGNYGRKEGRWPLTLTSATRCRPARRSSPGGKPGLLAGQGADPLDLAHPVLVRGAVRQHVQRRDAGLAVRGDPVPHVAFVADQRGALEQFGGDQGGRLVLAAGQVGLLDLLGRGLVAEPAGEVVVEVAPLGPHAADIQREERTGEIALVSDVVPDGQRCLRDHVKRPEGGVSFRGPVG